MRRVSPSPSRSPSPLFDTLPASRNSSISSESAGPCSTKVQLPRTLSKSAHLEHEVQGLQLGGELAEVPLEYLHETIRRLGPSLLTACNSTTPLLPADCLDLPSRLPCSLPPHLPSPTHLLAITFLDTNQRSLVPIHSLSLALASPLFTSLPNSSSAEPFLAETLPSLPIIHLSLPSTLSFPLLHNWILLRSPGALLQALDECSPIPDELPRPELSAAAMKRAAVLRGLWANVVALEMGDEELWEVMQGEWSFVLELLEREAGVN
ncbi:hypothetical protein BCR35DRAFT_331131 [Leucosporidium creatinivorum]|uniref:Clp1-like protein n=1 Tax=Leucosporidium creatinivorum TaxID=106004 RepID=A0A1Y2FHP9_9BASI|nr:hypothetical protein BCR35DRAFT_331131 [Leucosporidium creatinivorum]